MDSVSHVIQTNKNYTLCVRDSLNPSETNKIYHISFLASDILEQIGHLPICEVRQLPNWNNVVHYVIDPEAQKLLEAFHRYGLKTPDATQVCPFKDGSLRNRFTSLIGQDNVMTVYEEHSQETRKTLQGFLKHQKLQELEVVWREMTREWLTKLIQQGEINLFEASLRLIGNGLIKGILGYTACSPADIQMNADFWSNLFALSQLDMQSLKVLEAQGKPPEPSWSQKLLEASYGLCESWVQKAYIQYSPTMRPLDQLAQKIYASTIDNTGSFCGYLAAQGWDKQKIVEHIKIFLLAGLDTVGYFLGYMLYEYARNLDMQDKHAAHPEDIEKAYLETLRLYSLGGSLREARCDMVLSYPSGEGTIKDHYIRKGERINCAPYISGHDAKQWANPEVFDCERENLKNVRKNPHFGCGPHRCIGEKTAHKELLVIVKEVISNVSLSTKEKMPELLDSFTFRPMNDIKVKVEFKPNIL